MSGNVESREVASFGGLDVDDSKPSRYVSAIYRFPDVSGNWSIDNANGRRYASEVLAGIRGSKNPTVLGHVVKAMVAGERWSGVEVGFCQRLSEHLITSDAG